MTRDEIKSLLGNESPSALFNLKSTAFRKSGIEPESLTDERMLDLLAEEPRYWARPVAVIEGTLMASANAKRLGVSLGF